MTTLAGVGRPAPAVWVLTAWAICGKIEAVVYAAGLAIPARPHDEGIG